MSGSGADDGAALRLDIREGSLNARAGEAGVEIELERHEDGRLTPRCRERVIEKLRDLLGNLRWRARPKAYCTVGARGVSVRRVKLPAASREETRKLLRLQMEREFPLAPEELAWGFHSLGKSVAGVGGQGGQEVLLVAVKRGVVQDYADMVRECGARPVMTLGALARSYLIPRRTGRCAMLDIGRKHAELAVIEDGILESVRVLRWGGDAAFESCGQTAGIDVELNRFAEDVRARLGGAKLYVTGAGGRLAAVRSAFERGLDGGPFEWLDTGPREGESATIVGLGKVLEREGEGLPLEFEMESVRVIERPAALGRWKWAAVCGLVLVGLISMRYAEGLLLQGRLGKRLAAVRAYQASLPKIEGELGFLQYLKTNQAPYMDALHVLAEAAPPGTRIEAVSLNRRGELAMRTTLRDPQQVAEFRLKLVQSGLFETVALEEQTVGANRQEVKARFAGRWKTSGNAPRP